MKCQDQVLFPVQDDSFSPVCGQLVVEQCSTLWWQRSFCELHVSSSHPCRNSTFLIVVISKKDLYSSMILRAKSTPNPEKTKDESTGKGGKMVPWQSHRAQKRGEVDSRMRQEKDLWLTAGLTKLLQELNCPRKFSLSPTWNLTFCQQLESR